MLLIPQSPKDVYSLLSEQGHWPDRHDTMNPFDDPFIDYLNSLMLGCVTSIQSRPPYVQSSFWQQMPIADQLLAEVEGEVYHAIYERLYQVQYWYMIDTYLKFVDLPAPGTKEFKTYAKALRVEGDIDAAIVGKILEMASERGHKALTPTDLNAVIIQNGVATSLVPDSWPQSSAYRAAILQADDTPKQKLLQTSGDDPSMEAIIAAIREWREESYPRYALMNRAHMVAIDELHQARTSSNALKGAAARSRTLLVNDDIPVPTLLNFHFWWCHAGIEAVPVAGGKNLFYIAFTHPHLPVTKDHQGMTIQTDDSHSNHSLPGRSGGHARQDNGRIIHGYHRMWAYLNSQQLTQMEVANSMMQRPHVRLRQELPPMSRQVDAIWGSQDNCTTPVQDPWSNHGKYLHWDWMRDYPISTGFRSISKLANIHFMFTSTPEGLRALNRWRDAMARAAQQWCAIMAGPDSNYQITRIMAEQAVFDMRFSVNMPADAKNKTHKRFTFDFSGLTL